jgi:hypothetical protein
LEDKTEDEKQKEETKKQDYKSLFDLIKNTI